MADPYRGSLLDELRRDQMHSRDVAATLEFLRKELGQEGIPFGLIGALAMRHYGYVRFTEDVDILTTREGLDRIHDVLVGRGILPRAEGLRKKLRQTQYKVNIDVVTAGEHAGSNESPLVFPSPDSDAFIDIDGIRVVTLDKLIELKITSGVWAFRGRDLADVQELIKANQLAESFAQRLPEPIRAKYIELLEQSRRQIDIE